MRKVVNTVPDAVLVSRAGRRSTSTCLPRKAGRLGRSRSVRLPDWLAAEELEVPLPACHVLRLPQPARGLRAAGAGGDGAGLPVACSNTSSLPEVAGDAARYFDPSTRRHRGGDRRALAATRPALPAGGSGKGPRAAVHVAGDGGGDARLVRACVRRPETGELTSLRPHLARPPLQPPHGRVERPLRAAPARRDARGDFPGHRGADGDASVTRSATAPFPTARRTCSR